VRRAAVGVPRSEFRINALIGEVVEVT
jgi:hypothetical protein